MPYDKKRKRDRFLDNVPAQLFKRRGRTHMRLPEGMGQHLKRKGNKYLPVDSTQPMNRDPRGHFLQSIPSSLFRTGANVNLARAPILQSDPLFETQESQVLNTLRLNVENPQIRRITDRALQRVNYAPQIDRWMKNRSALDPDRQPILQGTAPWKTSDNQGESKEMFDDGGTYSERNSLPLYSKASSSRAANAALFGRRTVANLAPTMTGYMMTERDKRIALTKTSEVIIAAAKKQKENWFGINPLNVFGMATGGLALLALRLRNARAGGGGGVDAPQLLALATMFSFAIPTTEQEIKEDETNRKDFEALMKYGQSQNLSLFKDVDSRRFTDEELNFIAKYSQGKTPGMASYLAKKLPEMYKLENNKLSYIGPENISEISAEDIVAVRKEINDEYLRLQGAHEEAVSLRKKEAEYEERIQRGQHELKLSNEQLKATREQVAEATRLHEEMKKQLATGIEERKQMIKEHASQLDLEKNEARMNSIVEQMQKMQEENALYLKQAIESMQAKNVPSTTPNIIQDEAGFMYKFFEWIMNEREKDATKSLDPEPITNPPNASSTTTAPPIRNENQIPWVGNQAKSLDVSSEDPPPTIANQKIPQQAEEWQTWEKLHKTAMEDATETVAKFGKPMPSPASKTSVPTPSDVQGPFACPPDSIPKDKTTYSETGDISLNAVFTNWQKAKPTRDFGADWRQLSEILKSTNTTWYCANINSPILAAYVMQRNMMHWGGQHQPWKDFFLLLQKRQIIQRIADPAVQKVFEDEESKWSSEGRLQFMNEIIKKLGKTGQALTQKQFGNIFHKFSRNLPPRSLTLIERLSNAGQSFLENRHKATEIAQELETKISEIDHTGAEVSKNIRETIQVLPEKIKDNFWKAEYAWMDLLDHYKMKIFGLKPEEHYLNAGASVMARGVARTAESTLDYLYAGLQQYDRVLKHIDKARNPARYGLPAYY